MRLIIKTEGLDVNIDENGFSGKVDVEGFKAEGDFTWDQLKETYGRLIDHVPSKARRRPELQQVGEA